MKNLVILFVLIMITLPTSAQVGDGMEIQYSLYLNSTDRPKDNPVIQLGLDKRVEVRIDNVAGNNFEITSPKDFWHGNVILDYFNLSLQLGGFILTRYNQNLLGNFGNLQDRTFSGEILNSTGSFVMFMEWNEDNVLDRYSFVTNVDAESKTITLIRLPENNLGFYFLGIPMYIISSDTKSGIILEISLLVIFILSFLVIAPHYLEYKLSKRGARFSKAVSNLVAKIFSPLISRLTVFHRTNSGTKIGGVSSLLFLGYLTLGLINSYFLTIPALLNGVIDADHRSFSNYRILNMVANYLLAFNVLYFTSFFVTQLPNFVNSKKLIGYGILCFMSTLFGTILLNVGVQPFTLGQIRIFHLFSLLTYLGMLDFIRNTIVFADGAFRFTIKPRGFEWLSWYYGFAILPLLYIEIVYQRVASGLYPIYMFGLLYIMIQNLILMAMMSTDWVNIPELVAKLRTRTSFKVPLFAWEEAIRMKLLPPVKNAEESTDGELKLTQITESSKSE